MIFQGHSIGSSHSQLCHSSLDCLSAPHSPFSTCSSIMDLTSSSSPLQEHMFNCKQRAQERHGRRKKTSDSEVLVLCFFFFLAPTVCSASFWMCRLSKGTVPVIPLEPAVPQWLCSLSGYYRGGLLSWNTTYLKFPTLHASPPAPPMNTSTPGFMAVLTSLCAPVPSLGLSAQLEGLLPRALSTPVSVYLT